MHPSMLLLTPASACCCRYQVCLFCYQRLQNEYNNTCPGCRQQYSDDLEGVRQHIARKQQQQKAEPAPSRAAPASSSHAGHHHPHHGHAPHHGHTAHAAHAAASRATKPPGPAGKQRAVHADGTAHAARAAAHTAVEASSSLPSTASWAVAAPADTAQVQQQQQQPHHQQQQQVQQEPPPPTTGDESAWPTLGAAQQQPKPEPAGNAHERRRSSSSSLTALPPQPQRFEPCRSSFESTGSTHTAHSERQYQRQHHQLDSRHRDSDMQTSPAADQQEDSEPDAEQQQQQLTRNSSGYTTVQVSTVVSGQRHDVCVHVSHAEEVKVFPEAAGLLDVLQQAVHTSKLSSTEAAVQLVQCLRKLEADSSSNGSKQGNWLQQVLAAKSSNGAMPLSSGRPPLSARAPPPGFGPAAARPAAATANGISNGTHQQQQHELPPAGWSPAHRAALQAQQVQQAQHGETPQGSMHSVDSTNSLFSQGSSLSQSMWTDNGLPGVDLGLGAAARLGTGLGTTAHPAAVPPRLQMLWANGTAGVNGSSAAANGLGYSSSSQVTGPPPGFGGLGLGSRLNGTYNPLSFANAGAAAQGSSSLGVPPGFGLSESAKQQQAQQAALYQPF